MKYLKLYKHSISLNGGGNWYNLRLKKDIEITKKKEKGQAFYRSESTEWEFVRYQNTEVYDLLRAKMEHPDTVTTEFILKIEYFENFQGNGSLFYQGYVPMNGFSLDVDQGICKLKPKKKDDYTWYDEKAELKVDLSGVGRHTVFDEKPQVIGRDFMHLADIMNHILAEHATGLTFESLLFSQATNPVNGRANGYQYILLQPDPYFLPELPDDWKPETSLKDMLDLLIKAFKCEWIIDGNKLKVEHYNYFRNGGSYSGSPVVGVDLTNVTIYNRKYQVLADTAGRSTANRFSYAIDGFPARITYKWGYTGTDVNWRNMEVPIAFQHPLASKELSEEVTVTGFNHFPAFYTNEENSIDDKYFFVGSCQPAFLSGQYQLKSTTIGPNGSGTLIPNGYMYFERLIQELHVYDSYFKEGRYGRDNLEITFLTRKRIKQQEDIKFPHLEDFNPMDLIKTNFGHGEISTIKTNTDKGFSKVTLLFDPEDENNNTGWEPEPEQ